MHAYRLAACVQLTLIATAFAAAPLPEEMAQLRHWAAARFDATAKAPEPLAGITVVANNDPVQRNGRNGRAMNLAGTEYRRGLYCHADSKVVVQLPGPAKEFSALVGVDSNENTRSGNGSVRFIVQVEGKEQFRSEIQRENSPPVKVNIPLKGATQLTLLVDNSGDGIACDQADWADAKVTLDDGRDVWLGDLPDITSPLPDDTATPFSFVYDGRPSGKFLKHWPVQRSSTKLDEHRTGRTLAYKDAKTGLEVRCEAVVYDDFPTVEWTIYFKNAGQSDTPIIEKIQAVDMALARGDAGEFMLNHNVGSPCQANDYEPLRTELKPGETKRITTSGGRPTNSDLPYFNIELPARGWIVVLGWPGQWAAEFARDAGKALTVRGGQELTHLRLHPGEEIRTPRVVVQFWTGDRTRAQNVWRRWMLAHNVPRPGGELPPPHLAACSSHQYAEMINADEASQILFIDRYLEEGLKLDYWWMDAGWYPNKDGWPNTGTWEVDTRRFPRGLRAITDHGHEKGVKSIVWFEPERVTAGTYLSEKHPDWVLGGTLLNLGNDAAREWLLEHVDSLMKSQGIDLYRQDFNMDPLDYWRKADAPDRQGITEIRHVCGYLAWWDELRRRHPDMLIDTCASGGRRNDIETLRRAVPLLRSDYILEPVGNQNHTYGMASWIPLYGTGVNHFDAYGFRSCVCPDLNACYDLRKRDADWPFVRRMIAQWRQIAPDYYGDYYPLTSYSRGNDVWAAWQFDRPETGTGFIQVFRRGDSPYESIRLQLRGLDPAARYEVIDIDKAAAAPKEANASGTGVGGVDPTGQALTGKELLETGLRVELAKRPASALITYKRLP
jgi:alpha-galactosidase